MKNVRLAIFATHPIQYQVPWFIGLSRQPGIVLKVYYHFIPDAQQQGAGFNVSFQWDIPMLEGYNWQVVSDAQKSTKTLLEEIKPDVAILTGWHSSFLWDALWACRQLRIPTMIRGESNNLKKRSSWNHLAHRLLFSHYHAFLAIGCSNRELYLKNGVDPQKIFLSPYFVDNERLRVQFQAALLQRDQWRSYWKIPQDAYCFIYAGKIEPKKRIIDLLSALEIAARRNKKTHLLVVGNGQWMEKSKRFSQDCGLSVSFSGFLNQSEITRGYAAGDCLVLPSDYGETWGLVVNEAMVCGRPVIVSDRVGCGPDLIEEGITGSLFPFGNVKILAEKLVEFASNNGRLQRMGQTAQKKIEGYCVDEAVKGTLEGIKAVLKKGVGYSS